MRNISKHISYKEAIRSHTARRYYVKNVPNCLQIEKMTLIAENIFEPLRAGLGDKPIFISSFFRSNDLNNLIGGASRSQHMCNNGAAIDLDGDVFGSPNNIEIFEYIKNNLEFDQLIWEYGTKIKPEWVHVSYNEGKNRNQILIIRK